MANAITMDRFGEKYPDHYINCGIMEAQMMAVAAGFSLRGWIPFVHSFGSFVTRRCFDQLFLSLAYAKLNVKILGSDAGVTSEQNGGTHMPFEDLALMRAVPHATVLEATDAAMLKNLLLQVKEAYGVHYIRTTRKKAIAVYPANQRFEIGKAIVVRDGDDLAFVASGIMVAEALKASDLLAQKGIHAAVIDSFSIKPFDHQLIVDYAAKTGFLFSCENHNVLGGLGSAVAEAIAQAGVCCRLVRAGIREAFGQVGQMEYLKLQYGLNAEHLADQAQQVLKELGR